VETTEQAALPREMGCPSAQGWLYAPALPPQDALALLDRVLAPTRAHAAGPVPGSR